MIPDPASPYDVSISGAANRSIVTILQRANSLGLEAEVAEWLSYIDEKLRYEPRDWGDPIRNFRALRMVQFRGTVGPLVAAYSVHDTRPIVVLTEVAVVPDHLLAG